MKIIETDNYGRDYPDEKVILAGLTSEAANNICKIINQSYAVDNPRYWRPVDDDYKLQPGFEP